MKTKRRKLNWSGLPEGSTAGYVKSESCGRGNHNFLVAKSEMYAICTRCHMRRTFKKSKEDTQGPSGLSGDPFSPVS